jgi:uncharacterized DUF497 family protein
LDLPDPYVAISAGASIRGQRFEWDEAKRLSNIDKHGIDFADAVKVFADPAAYTFTSPVSAGEQRYVTIGGMKGVLVAVISTLRGPVVRIISARAARRSERQLYGGKD